MLRVIANLICIFSVPRQLVILSNLPQSLHSNMGIHACSSEKFPLDRCQSFFYFFSKVQTDYGDLKTTVCSERHLYTFSWSHLELKTMGVRYILVCVLKPVRNKMLIEYTPIWTIFHRPKTLHTNTEQMSKITRKKLSIFIMFWIW